MSHGWGPHVECTSNIYCYCIIHKFRSTLISRSGERRGTSRTEHYLYVGAEMFHFIRKSSILRPTHMQNKIALPYNCVTQHGLNRTIQHLSCWRSANKSQHESRTLKFNVVNTKVRHCTTSLAGPIHLKHCQFCKWKRFPRVLYFANRASRYDSG